MFISNYQSSNILKSGKDPLNFPSSSFSVQLSVILNSRFDSIGFMRGNHLDDLLSQPLIQWILVISPVTDQLFRQFLDKSLFQRGYKFNFMRINNFDTIVTLFEVYKQRLKYFIHPPRLPPFLETAMEGFGWKVLLK